MQYNFSGIIALVWLFAEIAGFILVGRAIGILPTLALVFLSMIVGFALLRYYGLHLMQQLQKQMERGDISEHAIANNARAMAGAVLLIIPGFVSDIIGILLFVPVVRDRLWQVVKRYMPAKNRPQPGRKPQGVSRTIDLDAEDYHAGDPENSPWRPSDDKNHRQ